MLRLHMGAQMSKSDRRRDTANSSRRNFLKSAAGLAAGAVLTRTSLGAQGAPAAAIQGSAFQRINRPFMITPDQALEWASFKAKGGPTYAGSVGGKRYVDFLLSKSQEFGLMDIESIDVTYDHYVVDDWEDRRTHVYDSGVAVEKLVTDGTPVPVVASYGMTSGSTAIPSMPVADALGSRARRRARRSPLRRRASCDRRSKPGDDAAREPDPDDQQHRRDIDPAEVGQDAPHHAADRL